MAASDKDIVISPQRGSTTNDPGIVFTGNGNDPISIFALDNTTGSLSFEGSAGQLFNITNNLTSGSIFSVNDVSGIPSIDVNADGTVSIVAYGGSVGIATTSPTSSYKLDVVGNVRIDGDLAVTSTTLVSNLNADTVDGLQATQFLRSDTDDDAQGFGSRANINSTGDSGLFILNGSRLGFDQTGTRSWTIKASGGNLNVTSGDGNGYLTGQINASTLDTLDSSQFLRSDQGDTINGILEIGGSSVSGGEGGELRLTFSPNTTLSGGTVNIDLQTNSFRVFENGGNNRGAFLALANCENSAGSEILHSGSTAQTKTGSLILQQDTTSTTNFSLHIRNQQSAPAQIKFSNNATNQNGYFYYRHEDGSSNNAGNSWHFNSDQTSTAVIIDQTAGNSGFYVGTNRCLTTADEGSNNGIDADLLDGQHGSYYQNAGNLNAGLIPSDRVAHNTWDIGDTTPETGRSVHETGIYTFNVNNNNLGTGTQAAYYSVLAFGQGAGGSAQIAAKWTSSGDKLYYRSLRDTQDDWWDWKEIWHSGAGNLTNNGDNYITFGPNSTWSRYLRIGGNGYQGNSTTANIATTNGNLHLDAATSNASYLNYYAGTAGVGFGNGASGVVAWMGPDGDLWKGSSDNTGSKYLTTADEGSGNGIDADTLDGFELSGSTSVSDKIFNNKGRTHGTLTDFNSSMTPGANYLQGGTNGPTGSGQWYGFMLGLGSEYGTTTGTSANYASQLYWGRQGSTSNNPYLWARDMEGGTWGSWRKFSAGNADTLDSLDSTQFLRSDADDITTGQIQFTKANNTATGGGQIYLNGATGNRIDFNTNGVDAPAFTTRSNGTKLVLYPAVSASAVDYALGIQNNTLWYSVPTTSDHHRWYGGTTNMMTLSGGNLNVTGNITASTLISDVADGTAPLTVTSTTLVSNLNADLLDGYHGSFSNVANTVPIRNSSGDINCRLVRQEYQNQSTISGGMVFRVNDSTDNYLRICNSTSAIRTFLGVTATGQDGNYILSNAADSASGALSFSGGLELTNGPGTIAGATFANGWLRIGTSTLGYAFDNNELVTFGSCIVNSASGSTMTFSNRPAFNGGTSGTSSPFTVDSTFVVSNLNADMVDGYHQGSLLKSDTTNTFNGTVSGRYLRFSCVAGRTVSSSGSLFPLEVYQSTVNTDAAMTFHIGSDFATYFGLDGTTNDLFTGGWSDGSTKHKIFHAGNIPQSAGWFSGTAPMVRTGDGLMEIGRYIDFHTTNSSTADYNARLDCRTNGVLKLTGSFESTNGLFTGSSSEFFIAANGVSNLGTTVMVGNCTVTEQLNLLGSTSGDTNKYMDVQVGNGNAFQIRRVTGGDFGHQIMALFRGNAEVELYYNNSKKIETEDAGVRVTGRLRSKTTSFSTGANADGYKFPDSGAHEIGRNTTAGNNVLKAYGGSGEFRVKGDGDCENTGGNYNTIGSDERLKENIVDASSQWDDIKGIRFRNFNYKSNPNKRLLGCIAQELQQVCPNLIHSRPAGEEEIADDSNILMEGDEVLNFHQIPLLLKSAKALQEAMERIEALEAKVAALESGT